MEGPLRAVMGLEVAPRPSTASRSSCFNPLCHGGEQDKRNMKVSYHLGFRAWWLQAKYADKRCEH
eukprot:scaffold120059_cov18-Tisochrysis_lutea.AAC.1